MGTLGLIAAVSLVAVPLSAQPWDPPATRVERPTQQSPSRRPAPRPMEAKPALPVPTKPASQEADRIDKRRERMKGRDTEIDRMMKNKAKQR